MWLVQLSLLSLVSVIFGLFRKSFCHARVVFVFVLSWFMICAICYLSVQVFQTSHDSWVELIYNLGGRDFSNIHRPLSSSPFLPCRWCYEFILEATGLSSLKCTWVNSLKTHLGEPFKKAPGSALSSRTRWQTPDWLWSSSRLCSERCHIINTMLATFWILNISNIGTFHIGDILAAFQISRPWQHCGLQSSPPRSRPKRAAQLGPPLVWSWQSIIFFIIIFAIFLIFVIFGIFGIFSTFIFIIILRFWYHVNELSDNAEAASGSSQGKEQVVLLHFQNLKNITKLK